MHKGDNYNNEKRVLKGGSFLDTRDGDEREDKMKIRVSTRIGRKKDYTAQNVGFRCVQDIDPSEVDRIPAEGFRVIRLRPPVHHHADPEKSHFRHERREDL